MFNVSLFRHKISYQIDYNGHLLPIFLLLANLHNIYYGNVSRR